MKNKIIKLTENDIQKLVQKIDYQEISTTDYFAEL